MRDRDLGTLRQQHPDRNFQSPPGWIYDTDRPISSLRSAKNPQGNTMKWVKGVEDLGTISISVCERAIERYAAMALMKRSPNMTAN